MFLQYLNNFFYNMLLQWIVLFYLCKDIMRNELVGMELRIDNARGGLASGTTGKIPGEPVQNWAGSNQAEGR